MCLKTKKKEHLKTCNIFFSNHFFFLPNGSILLLLFTFHSHTHFSKHRMHQFSLSHQQLNKQDQLKQEIQYTPLFSPVLSLLQNSNFTQYSIVVLSEATDDKASPRCLANALGSIYSVTSGALLVSDHMQLEHKTLFKNTIHLYKCQKQICLTHTPRVAIDQHQKHTCTHE